MQKESLFSTLLVEAYKIYLDDKVARLPDNFNYFDYALKFCNHEIVSRKNLLKNGGTLPPPYTLPESLFLTSLKPAPIASLMSAMPTRIASPKSHSTPPPPPFVSPQTSTGSQLAALPPPQYPLPQATHPNITITTVPTAQLLQPRAAAITSIQSMVTPTTTQTTSIARGGTGIVATSTSTSPYAVSANTSGGGGQSTTPRPRGRPPGSKNANVSGGISFPSSFLPQTTGGVTPRLDPATMAAIMSMCNPSTAVSSTASSATTSYADTNAVSAFLNEFYKFSGLTTGLNSAQNFMAPPLLPSTSAAAAAAAALPQFDMKNFISSAASTNASSSTMSSSTAAASTIISVGSGQLTITPSTTSAGKLHKDILPTSKIYSSPSSSNIFADMPGISVTKVKPPKQSTIVASGIPKDLPKSLTITPTGYSSAKTSASSAMLAAANQFPYVTMQPEKRASNKAPANPRPRKKQQKTLPNLSASFGAFAGPSTSTAASAVSSAQYSMPNAAAFNAATMHDYSQQMAMLSQYSDLMKSIDPSHAAALLSYSKLASLGGVGGATGGAPAKSGGKVRGRKPSALVVPTVAAAGGETAFTNKGRLSVKQLQSMQQQPALRRDASPQLFATPSLSSPAIKPSKSSPAPQFQMPEIPGRNMSPYGGGMSVSPVLAHSPNKSPVLPPQLPSPGSSGSGGSGGGGSTGSGANQSSPKTLQQKLAERKKGMLLNDAANNQQMAAIAAAAVSSRYNSSELQIIFIVFFLCAQSKHLLFSIFFSFANENVLQNLTRHLLPISLISISARSCYFVSASHSHKLSVHNFCLLSLCFHIQLIPNIIFFLIL